MMWGWGWGYGWSWAVVILLAVAAITTLIVVLTRSLSGNDRSRGSNARHILEERLARGEITPDEFAERIKLLERG